MTEFVLTLTYFVLYMTLFLNNMTLTVISYKRHLDTHTEDI